MAKIKNKVTKPKFHSLNEWNLNPLGVHQTYWEFFNPEAFYDKQLQQDAEMEPGEFDGMDKMKLLRKDDKDDSRKK